VSEAVVPHSISEAAAALAGAAAQGRPVRIVGGGSKLAWGAGAPARALRLHTSHLSRVVVNEDGASATISAGTPLARAQAILARSGLMLAIDPQLGLRSPTATVGGVLATADTGPLSHRFGPPREQVLGITAALGDGSVLRTGPRGASTQDGLDATRLLVGSFGTLGVLLAVDVRLRALPTRTVTALATGADPERLCDVAGRIGRENREIEALDVAWRAGRGGLLVQLAGDDAEQSARYLAEMMEGGGLDAPTVRLDDADLWARQRAGQRSATGCVLRVRHHPRQLASVLRLADRTCATVVGRAVQGVAYLTLEPSAIATVRSCLPDGATAVVLDIPADARDRIDPWGVTDGAELALMRELKARFDPAGVCNPGVFVGRI
jgi:glycolate oxidase FAD binding subunit